jgi:hypothetical protein
MRPVGSRGEMVHTCQHVKLLLDSSYKRWESPNLWPAPLPDKSLLHSPLHLYFARISPKHDSASPRHFGRDSNRRNTRCLMPRVANVGANRIAFRLSTDDLADRDSAAGHSGVCLISRSPVDSPRAKRAEPRRSRELPRIYPCCEDWLAEQAGFEL